MNFIIFHPVETRFLNEDLACLQTLEQESDEQVDSQIPLSLAI